MALEQKPAVEIPDPPAILPARLQTKWKKDYADALTQAQADFPEDVPAQKQAALREANRILRVPEPASYEDAKALADWQVMERMEHTVKNVPTLTVVTIDGKKHRFPVPPPKDEKPKN